MIKGRKEKMNGKGKWNWKKGEKTYDMIYFIKCGINFIILFNRQYLNSYFWGFGVLGFWGH